MIRIFASFNFRDRAWTTWTNKTVFSDTDPNSELNTLDRMHVLGTFYYL